MFRSHRIKPYYFIIGVISILASCQRGNNNENNEAHFEKIVDSTAYILNSGETEKAFAFLDSSYNAFPNPGVGDLFKKYNYKRDYYLKKKKDYATAMSYADTMFMILEEHDPESNTALYASAHFLKGDIFFEEKRYNDAYEFYYKGKAIALKNMDTCAMGEYSYRLGMVCYKQTKYPEAAVYFKKGFYERSHCIETMANFAFRQELLCNTALSYFNMNKLDSAIHYYSLALTFIDHNGKQYINESSFSQIAKGVIYGNQADVYLKKGDTAQAEALLIKSININIQKDHDVRDGRFSQIKLAHIYTKTNRLKKAGEILDEVKKSLDASPDVEGIVLWNKVAWQYYDKLKQTEKAFHYLQEFVRLKEEKTKDNKQLVNADVNVEFKNIERGYEVDILKRENTLKNAYLFLVIIFSVLVIVILLLIWQNWRRSKKNITDLTSLNSQVNIQNTQLALTMAELEQSNKDKDRIMQVLAHDLRNPLGGISAISVMLLEGPGRTSEEKEMIQMIKLSSDNSLAMIKDIMEITLNKELSKLHKEPVDMQHLLGQCINVLQFKADEKKQYIELHTHGPKMVNMNREKIWRVINNLIVNAIKFSPDDTLINVKLSDKPGAVRVSVEDQGIGIPEELKGKIFDTFTSAKRYGTSGEQPFGLGLSISKQIVEAHGGSIGFESLPEGGTLFYIELPV